MRVSARTILPGQDAGRREGGIVRAAFLSVVLFLIAFSGAAVAEPNYPELTGQIIDQADLLTPEDEAAILAELHAMEGASTDQMAVVTVTSLDGYAIEEYGIGLARKWALGQKDKDNGILLLVAPNERKVRVEVGRKLEPVMTDTMSSIIIQNAMLPRFRRGDYAGGIRDGVRDIKSVLLGDAEAVNERARGGRTPDNDPTALIHILIFMAVVAFVIYRMKKADEAKRKLEASLTPEERRRLRRARRRRGGDVIVIPGGSGDWGGGWSGGNGGGGWSGGGGSFGGGGASGSW